MFSQQFDMCRQITTFQHALFALNWILISSDFVRASSCRLHQITRKTFKANLKEPCDQNSDNCAIFVILKSSSSLKIIGMSSFSVWISRLDEIQCSESINRKISHISTLARFLSENIFRNEDIMMCPHRNYGITKACLLVDFWRTPTVILPT